jgi:hypothetical protein
VAGASRAPDGEAGVESPDGDAVPLTFVRGGVAALAGGFFLSLFGGVAREGDSARIN